VQALIAHAQVDRTDAEASVADLDERDDSMLLERNLRDRGVGSSRGAR